MAASVKARKNAAGRTINARRPPSRTVKVKPNQYPTFKLIPRHATSDGGDACALAEGYGMTPDPWQKIVLDGWLGRLKSGRWAASDCGLAVPRQNGKNAVLEFLELFLTCILGMKILHTAHEVKTCRKHFMRMKAYFENPEKYPEMAAMVKSIRNTNGQEAIVLKNGGSIEFIARSKSSGRGFTVDVIVCDEAQELTDEQMEAMQPAISSAPSGNPLTIYTGTPTPPTSAGTVFERMRYNAHHRHVRRVCWFEWGADEVGDINDRSRWERMNPSLGIRLILSVVESESQKMTPEGFARERLGWWDDSQANKTDIDMKAWREAATTDPAEEGYCSYAVKFTPDGASVTLAVALRPKDKDMKPHVEVVENRSMKTGVGWLAEWLSTRWPDCIGIVIDGRVGAPTLVQDLKDIGVPMRRVIVPTARDVADACSMMEQGLADGTFTHYNQPLLNEAAAHARHRKIGDGFGYETSDPMVDTNPLEAVSLAYWNQKTSRRHPERRQEMIF